MQLVTDIFVLFLLQFGGVGGDGGYGGVSMGRVMVSRWCEQRNDGERNGALIMKAGDKSIVVG